jgi:hypothetical protein
VANVTARVPRIIATVAFPAFREAREPIRVMPEMAFEPDISGVCSVDGTLEMSSKPRKIDKTKTKVRNTGSMCSLTYS